MTWPDADWVCPYANAVTGASLYARTCLMSAQMMVRNLPQTEQRYRCSYVSDQDHGGEIARLRRDRCDARPRGRPSGVAWPTAEPAGTRRHAAAAGEWPGH